MQGNRPGGIAGRCAALGLPLLVRGCSRIFLPAWPLQRSRDWWRPATRSPASFLVLLSSRASLAMGTAQPSDLSLRCDSPRVRIWMILLALSRWRGIPLPARVRRPAECHVRGLRQGAGMGLSHRPVGELFLNRASCLWEECGAGALSVITGSRYRRDDPIGDPGHVVVPAAADTVSGSRHSLVHPPGVGVAPTMLSLAGSTKRGHVVLGKHTICQGGVDLCIVMDVACTRSSRFERSRAPNLQEPNQTKSFQCFVDPGHRKLK